ncbi:MAG TPA: acylphosphatase [Xanthobacteraceae bacterium]
MNDLGQSAAARPNKRLASSASRAIRRVMIRGHVQGVGFRAWTEHEARRRALEGRVRNRRDGSVKAAFAGGPIWSPRWSRPAGRPRDRAGGCGRGA